jgi:serine/threonine-protein kinase
VHDGRVRGAEALRSASFDAHVVALGDVGARGGAGAVDLAAALPWPSSRPALAAAVERVMTERRAARLASHPNLAERDTMPAPPAARTSTAPALIGRYRILSLVGRGGMGDVYRCCDDATERVVAIKTMRCPADSADDPAVERFRVEAAALSRLVHPRIVAPSHFGVDHTRGEMYLVLQYVDGPSLRNRLDEGVRLALRETLQIGWDMADALAHAHERGVVHRDVKPENVLIDELGQPLLTDFGLARLGDYSVSGGQVIAGTPNYMAPEQILDPRRVDGRADQYGLGAMLHELLAGPARPPAEAERPASILRRLAVRRPSLIDVGAEVSSRLDALVARLLEPEPADRFPGDVALLAELAAAGHELGLAFERY